MNLEKLEAISVGREKLLDGIVEEIENNLSNSDKSNHLLVAKEGGGKTHVIELLKGRLASATSLVDKAGIILVEVEQLGITSWLDIQMLIFKGIAKNYPQEYQDRLAKDVESLYDLPPKEASPTAEYLLEQFISEKSLLEKKLSLLILVENFDSVLSNLKPASKKRFINYITSKSYINIVATSTHVPQELRSRKSALYGFFSPVYLKPLSFNDFISLLHKISQLTKRWTLLDRINSDNKRDSLKAFYYLAKGNHRICIVFLQILSLNSSVSITDAFLETVKKLSFYYKAKIQYLSPQQKKVIRVLIDCQGAVNVKEIASRCFISQQTTAAQLGILLIDGLLAKERRGRKSFYELSDPFMRMCLSNNLKSVERNRLLVNFLSVWYSSTEAVYLDLDRYSSIFSITLDPKKHGRVDTEELIGNMYRDSLNVDAWISKAEILVKLYDREQLLPVLAKGIVKYIPHLLDEMVSNSAAERWFQVWRKAGGSKQELELALRWLDAVVKYKMHNGNDESLLKLPREERILLLDLIGLFSLEDFLPVSR